jgi:hypothetical protein
MKRLALLSPACALAFLAVVGCGPMKVPLPARLDDETQKKVDKSWDRAFTPADRLAHQDLLDVMVGTQAYQLGIDTFVLRAEKRVAGGKVVMEVAFDRAKPADDRFEVSVYDDAGKRVRSERYSRQEIDATCEVLFGLPPENPNAPDPPEVAARRAAHKARWEKINGLFPGAKEMDEAEGKDGRAPVPRAKG